LLLFPSCARVLEDWRIILAIVRWGEVPTFGERRGEEMLLELLVRWVTGDRRLSGGPKAVRDEFRKFQEWGDFDF